MRSDSRDLSVSGRKESSFRALNETCILATSIASKLSCATWLTADAPELQDGG